MFSGRTGVGNWNFEHAPIVFPPADYRFPFLVPARQQYFIPNLDHQCQTDGPPITVNLEFGYDSHVSFSEQLRFATSPFNFEGVQSAENYVDVMQMTDHTRISDPDERSSHRPSGSESRSSSPVSQPAVQILGNKSFLCLYNKCASQFTRISDLKRHHFDKHVHVKYFYCRFAGCRRAKRGFSRKDKRDDHEKRVHD
jgi:hypothetical protein